MDKDVMCWSQISPELFLHLSSYLSEEDLVSCSGVCMTWFKWINDLIFYKSGTLIFRPHCLPVNIAHYPAKSRIHITDIMPKEFTKLNTSQLSTVSEICISYEKEYEADDEWISNILPIIHNNVDYLKFKNIIIHPCNFEQLLNNLPLNIETFIIQIYNTTIDFSTIEDNCMLFSCLVLQRYNLIKYIFPGKCINKMYDISEEVNNFECSCNGLNELQTVYLMKQLKTIETIKLIDTINMTIESINYLSKMTNLKYLEISDAHLINDDEWCSAMENGFNNLINLKINRCKGFSNKSIRELSRKHHLHNLEIEVLNCNHEAISSLLSLKLNFLQLHIRHISIGELLNNNYNCNSLILVIYPPFIPESQNISKMEISLISNNCKLLGISFQHSFQYTIIAHSI